MITIKRFCIVAFLMCFISCDVEVDNYSTIPVAGFPSSVDEAQAILIGTYDRVRDITNNTSYFEDRGDSFDVGIVGGPTDAYSQSLFPGNAPTWTSFYSVLQNINILIEEVPQFTSGNTNAQRILAEAYYLRAHTYFLMAR